MSLDTIIHPTTGVHYSIFSNPGRNLLKNYLRTYKYGGNNLEMIGGKCVRGDELEEECWQISSQFEDLKDILEKKTKLYKALIKLGKAYPGKYDNDRVIPENMNKYLPELLVPSGGIEIKITIGQLKTELENFINTSKKKLNNIVDKDKNKSERCRGVIDVGGIKTVIHDDPEIERDVFCSSHTPYLYCKVGKDCVKGDKQCYNTETACRIDRAKRKWGISVKPPPKKWTNYTRSGLVERALPSKKIADIYRTIIDTFGN